MFNSGSKLLIKLFKEFEHSKVQNIDVLNVLFFSGQIFSTLFSKITMNYLQQVYVKL